MFLIKKIGVKIVVSTRSGGERGGNSLKRTNTVFIRGSHVFKMSLASAGMDGCMLIMANKFANSLIPLDISLASVN